MMNVRYRFHPGDYDLGVKLGGIVSLAEESFKLLCLILVKILSKCGHTSKYNSND